MKVLVFGSCNIDYVYQVGHFVKPGETISSRGRECFPGGKGLNQSIAVARSGVEVYHAGCIGRDGIFLKEVLVESGVNTRFLKVLDAPTGHAIIQVDEKGENCIILCAGANHMVEPDYIDRVIAEFDRGDILILQNEISNIDYIIERAYARGMQIVLNPSPFHENLKKLDLGRLQYLILNEVEASEFCGSRDPMTIFKYFRETYGELKVMLTLGARGCVYFDRDREVFCPIFSVEVVDTTSAGDTFTGYFISGIKNGFSMEKIVKRASAASALAVSRQGAASSIPYAWQVEEAMAVLKTGQSHDFEIERQKEQIVRYIESHLTDAKLEEAAALLGYSRTYAATWIKLHTGRTFSDLLKRARCGEAARLLRETHLSVQEIIARCGYENGSFFREIFAEQFGKTPLEYRKFYETR